MGNTITDLDIEVPVFNSPVPTSCRSMWPTVGTITASGTFTAELTSASTALTLEGTFPTPRTMTGSVGGTCDGRVVLLGMEVEASRVD